MSGKVLAVQREPMAATEAQSSTALSLRVFGRDFWGCPTKLMLVKEKSSFELFGCSPQTFWRFLLFLLEFQRQTKLAGSLL